ncbi:MAG: hypothetical protein DRJ42_01210 [Deltaproteobacteria bacterium]|nr:MAG: hypothetical protein DRJ42_01210 [Deltaproteobacteria bacterium]
MMHLDRPYEFDDDEARTRLRALADYWHAKHGIAATWTEDEVTLSGRVKGVKFEGRVQIGGGHVKAEVKAGFLAEKLGGRHYVQRKLDDYLDPAKTIEALQARVPR